ncbi:MAG: glycosyltransferase family 2 protein, partial [Holosporaceae bacterium]|nr:glycosyltransferase family 2 protein [Holosporaceae bacterium]
MGTMQKKSTENAAKAIKRKSMGLELSETGKHGKSAIDVSVVIPIFNEQENVEQLSARLLKTMDSTGKRYEVIFVDDGSSDNTIHLLRSMFKKRSDVVRVIIFNGNYGQYVAILAGFEHVRGDVVVTLDADLQNLPEEIPNLLRKIEEGYDLVGGYRVKRQDSFFRTYASKIVNHIRAGATGIEMKD